MHEDEGPDNICTCCNYLMYYQTAVLEFKTTNFTKAPAEFATISVCTSSKKSMDTYVEHVIIKRDYTHTTCLCILLSSYLNLGTRLQGPATTQTTYRVVHMWASLPHADQVDPASHTF